jgi:hypothetical protein
VRSADPSMLIGLHECADREGMTLASSGDRLAQGRDMVDQQGLLDREETSIRPERTRDDNST